MGFLQTIKNKLGIGGVKVVLHVPSQVSKDAGIITGKVVLTSPLNYIFTARIGRRVLT